MASGVIPMFIIVFVLTVAAVVGVITARRLIHICAPNEVLIFSGKKRRVGKRLLGYRIVKGGRGFRVPLLERVDRLDLTNMVIDVAARNAYSRGGIPLTVNGVANVKIGGFEPVLNNAIERFLGKPRLEIMKIAKATLEGALRGVLATMTPEEVNEDRILFAERLVREVEQDLTALGLVVDTLKIQNVQDDVSYLDSIGRRKNAEIIRSARIAEARAKADAVVRAAENRQREARAKITASVEIAKADATKRLRDIKTLRAALVAEEQATVAAAVAKAVSEVEVQKARVETVRRQLDAEVVQPAKAACLSAEAAAKASAEPIVQDGCARAEVLTRLAESWRNAGPHAREIFLLQKLPRIIEQLTEVVAPTEIEQVTMIDGRAPGGGTDGRLSLKAFSSLEQLKEIFGVDLVEALGRRAVSGTSEPNGGSTVVTAAAAPFARGPGAK